MTKDDMIKKWNEEIELLEIKLEDKTLSKCQRGTILFQVITLENCISDLKKLK